MTKNNYNGDCYYGLVVETYNLFHPQGNINDAGQLILDMAIPWFSAKEQIDAGIWKLTRKRILSNNRLVYISKASEFNLLEQLEYSQIKYEVYQDGKLVDTLIDEIQCRYYGKFELELLLEKAGFCEIRTYGDFQDKEASDGDEVVTFRCFKKLNK